jgi:hypothetical protein
MRGRWIVLLLGLGACERAENVASEKLGDAASAVTAKAHGELDRWLEGAPPGSIQARVASNEGSAREVAAIAAVLAGAVDSDTVILPIYQPIGKDEKDVDAAIGDMPRTEVIDGVTVGFTQLHSANNKEKVDEEAYLVVWRREDALVGFLYKKKRRIDIAALVATTPRLMKLIHAAI